LRNAYDILAGKPGGKRPLRRPGADGMLISEWVLGKDGGKLWIGCIWLRTGTSGELV
jgi:hypothetical protein